ncbi:hypothetical protein [Streptomyces sp. NPDC002666]
MDAAPVRAHILNLQACSLGTRQIAKLAGCDRKRVMAITHGRPERGTGPQEKVRPELAAAVLAIEPTLDNLALHVVIDGTGTRRRLQALVVAGWPQRLLAKRLGMTPGSLGIVITAASVTVRTARAVRALYDDVWNQSPTKCGASAGGVSRARNKAAERHWAPVGAWDDETIDDPSQKPVGIRPRHTGG